MAIVYAIKSGLWSDTDVWNTSLLPSVNDDVHTNGYEVTIDQSVVVTSLTNKAETGVSAGGRFLIGGDYSLSYTTFEPYGLVEPALLEVTANCTLIFSGTINTGIESGNGILITDEAVEEVTITTNAISASGDNSFAISCDTGKLVLEVTGNISGSSDGDSTAIEILDTAELELETTGSIVGGKGPYSVFVDAGEAAIVVDGSIQGGTDLDCVGLLIDSAVVELVVEGSILGHSAEGSVGLSSEAGDVTIICGGVIGGTAYESYGIYASAGTLELTSEGTIEGGTGSFAHGIALGSTPTILDVWRISGGTAGESVGLQSTNADLDISVVNVIGGTSTLTAGVVVSDGDLDLTAALISGGTAEGAHGVSSISTLARPRVVETETATAGDGAHAVRFLHKDDTVILHNNASASNNGTMPFLVPIVKIKQGEISAWTLETTTGATTVLSNAETVAVTLPDAKDVREGIVFGSGAYTGTLAVPDKKQVAFGIAVDDTEGVAALKLPQVVNYFGEQIRAAFNLESGLVFIESVVYHGANANKERPSNEGPIIWVGSVEPTNAIDGDVWVYN